MPAYPILDFGHFSISELKNLWDTNKILINKEYQRSYIWKPRQKQNLIESVINGFSVGVLVGWINPKNQLEILDGQQRIRTIIHFLEDKFPTNQYQKFSELSLTQQSEFEAYSVYYLKLKSSLTEEEISDIFTRLQEGTPLNTPEKVNAFRGNFRETFIKSFFKFPKFFGRMKNTRFRARFLAAQLLLLELETDYTRQRFPNMTYYDFKQINNKYKVNMPPRKILQYDNCIAFLGKYLFNEVRAISPRDWVTFYLLGSFLLKNQANQKGLGISFRKFALKFLNNLSKFSIYDTKVPKNMEKPIFELYMNYKQFGRKATDSGSIEERFKIALSEYKRLHPVTFKDPIRLFNEEQKIRIYFQQNGLCPICNKPLNFEKAQCHHKYEHALGGQTKIQNGQMVHHKCHEKLHNN